MIFLGLFGYSVNLLTLFALVLAIGIVVDDAIVVVEAVHAKLEGGVKDANLATHKAMDEITCAIISITLVMAAVNALTLSPALCALFLKPHDNSEDAGKNAIIAKMFQAAATITQYELSANASWEADIWGEIRSDKRALEEYKEFEAYRLATDYSEELLNNGLINYLEVITARQNALFSQLDLIDARFSELNATVELYRALGGGWK